MHTVKKMSIGVVLVAVILSSCSNLNKSQKGAAIGTAGGAVVGGIIGKITGNTGLGAIIGAAVGGVGGAVIGHKMDKQAAEIQKDLPSAKVERVGEGIVVEFSDKILFGFNQSNLGAEAKKGLDKLVVILVKYPDTNIEIQGHTDNKGTPAYNQSLSEKRAASVSAYLAQNKIAVSRLSVKGFGAESPKYSNETEEGRAQNRNVQFLISANDKMKADAAKETGTR